MPADANLTYAAIVAPLDARVCGIDAETLGLITLLASRNPEVSADEAVARGDISLDKLCRATNLPKPHVFAAVARLEEFGLIPESCIR
jgi:hypothetical protein